MLGLVSGVVALNGVFLLVGYCSLAPFLRGASVRTWTSFAGVALVAGCGLVGIVLSWLAVAGSSTGLPVLAAVAAVLALAGIVAAWLHPGRGRWAVASPRAVVAGGSQVEQWLAAAAAGALLATCFLVVAAGFRTSPWLDDAWTFWLPKGVELSRSGLDPRVFLPGSRFVPFTSLDYPLWWSVVGGLDVAAVGRIDLRALNAQTSVLYVGYAAAAARLLWSRVRPGILLPGLLLAIGASELVAQTESGGADVPLALYTALALIGAVLWLGHGERLALWLTFVFTATALNTKAEASGLVVVLLVVGGCFAWRRSTRRVAAVAAAVLAAFATLMPWIAWRALHRIGSDAIGAAAFDPVHLFQQRERLGPAADAVAHQLLQPRGWFLAVPLLVVASVAVAVRERRVAWLAPAVMVVAGYAFFVWVYWAGSVELSFWLDTSAYRVVDSMALPAAVALPVVVERVWAGHAPPAGG